MKQQQNGLYEQKQLAALKTISSIQQFIVVQLPTETIVDILLFVPNEELVLSFVFVSRTFSAICIPILRTRFAVNTFLKCSIKIIRKICFLILKLVFQIAPFL
jgi:hypothetical protein